MWPRPLSTKVGLTALGLVERFFHIHPYPPISSKVVHSAAKAFVVRLAIARARHALVYPQAATLWILNTNSLRMQCYLKNRRRRRKLAMRIEELIGCVRPRRKVNGIAAALLPFDPDGNVAVEAFQNHLRATHAAGLGNAVNMDTGYVNYLREDEQLEILKWTREALGPGVNFVAGVYIEGRGGDV